ncbi:hypothetical protein SAMN05216296_0131 [Pseudomonas pohangensis]|jgi:hypothetical protein|uniref:Uncharacterized protein n=1 Tax=Pseudomonas pohangensis TaxID=364197 RepID=A0A1H2DXH1_9PSED|nr:hypothetical protein [Pseudomonas pohangensis]SDT87504.1 hypothetical protein SAMN05216296_0131 [Pseudomonas pohangensis]
MRAPTNLHILATSAGLTDEAVVELWNEARAAAISELGDDSHPEYKRKAEGFMVRLIEDKATANVPANLVPWVLFDIHMGMAIVEVRNSIKNAGGHVREYFSNLRGNHAA